MTNTITAMVTTTRTLPTQGPFSLEESELVGFGHRDARSFDGVMRLAFTVDGDHERTAGVEVRQAGETLDLTITSDADPDTVAAQVARVLSVDVDAAGFADLGRRDPVVGALQAAAPGLRPPQFYSPYEAAAWSIMSARRTRHQGIAVRERVSAAHGVGFELAGRLVHAFPTPSRLHEVSEVQGLPALAAPRLHAVAEAAARGDLDVTRLTTMTQQEATLAVQALPGIGPFYGALVVVRACGLPDALPLNEPRSRAALERLHGITRPLDDEAFTRLADGWSPYRMWVLFLSRAAGGRVSAVTPGS